MPSNELIQYAWSLEFLQQMSGGGRTFVLILFVWAGLTIVTPMLVRWSAAAKPQFEFKAKGETREEMYTRRVMELLPRRALVPTVLQQLPLAPEPAPSSAPAPEPEPLSVLNGLEISQTSTN